MTSKMTIDQEGNKFWKNEQGYLHREDGPAIEWSNGDISFYLNGELHCIGGPAVRYTNGIKRWWVNKRDITGLVNRLIVFSSFDESVHLEVLAKYWAEKGDPELLKIIQPYIA